MNRVPRQPCDEKHLRRWQIGASHETPVFDGCWACELAVHVRRQEFWGLLWQRSPTLNEWPESKIVFPDGMIDPVHASQQLSIPSYAQVREGMSRTQRRRALHAQKKWQGGKALAVFWKRARALVDQYYEDLRWER